MPGDETYGYTRGVNLGIKVALDSDFPWKNIVLLNSDTVVTKDWMKGLSDAIYSRTPHYGMVGPMTNAGSYQSIPEFAIATPNVLKDGWTPQHMSDALFWISQTKKGNSVIDTRLLNGFCMMINREVFFKIGFMNEKLFPIGYGEETEFQLRLHQAGYSLGIVGSVYVYHQKSQSFGTSTRNTLSKAANKILDTHWGRELEDAKQFMNGVHELVTLREEVKFASSLPAITFEKEVVETKDSLESFLFVLPKKPNPLAGGVISIIDIAVGLAEKGIAVQLAITPKEKVEHYKEVHPYAHSLSLFWGYDEEYREQHLAARAKKFQFIVATYYLTVSWMKDIVKASPHLKPVYFIQDYEPWFFKEESPEYKEAYASYDLIPNQVGLLKTNWLRSKVESNHRLPILKMIPGIDFSSFSNETFHSIQDDGKIHIASMVRPRTPRRSALFTLKVLNNIRKLYPDLVVIHIFGYRPNSIETFGMSHLVHPDFKTHGLLDRSEVRELLAQSDIFVDLSIWQAFGRTGLEAMAARCVPVMPILGGADEYCTHLKDCLLVSTNQYAGNADIVSAVSREIQQIIKNPKALAAMQHTAQEKARRFTLERQTQSTID
eukprot:Awhi_evm1s12630